MKIYMFVYNNCKYDARVLKEAKTLASLGYDVSVIALLDNITTPYEERDGFKIIRVPKNPIHYRIRWGIKRLIGIVRIFFKRIIKDTQTIIKILFLPLKIILNLIFCIFAKVAYKHANAESALRVYRQLGGANSSFWHRIISSLLVIACSLRSIFMKLLKTLHKPLSFLDYYWRCFKITRKDPADIYHAHDLHTLPIAYFMKSLNGRGVVYDSHELYTETSSLSFLDRMISKTLERHLIRHVNSVITVNKSIADELSRRYQIRTPAIVMNCPPTRSQARTPKGNTLRNELDLDQNIPIILYHGGYAPNRGLKNLILSAQYLKKGKIVLMGWGKIEGELKDLVITRSLMDKVYFIGPVPQDVLINYITSADIGVIPYQFVGLNNYYTTPNKLFEYMAAGIPVVGSNFPELKRIIDGCGLGATFNPEDPKDIAGTINYVLVDSDKYMVMKENAVKASKIYNWEEESKKLAGVYELLKKDHKMLK